jgi:selenocysteine lyase/cysteine desulfurase
MWVNPLRLASCEPGEVGWFSHSNPFEFDIKHFEYAGDALRFWGGTPSVAPALVAAHAIETLLDIGLDRIQAHNRSLIEQLCSSVDAKLLASPGDPVQRGATAVLDLGTRQDQFADRLRKAGLQFDIRREGIRLSPHFYNTTDDIEAVLGCLR